MEEDRWGQIQGTREGERKSEGRVKGKKQEWKEKKEQWKEGKNEEGR